MTFSPHNLPFFSLSFNLVVTALEEKIIVSKLGDNATLSCIYREKELRLKNLRVYWQIADDQEKCSVVHALISSQDNESEQCIHFKNRTRLFWDKLESGDFSLLLLNVSQSDEHRYKCVVQEKIEYPKVIHRAEVVLSLAGKNLYHLYIFARILIPAFQMCAISILCLSLTLTWKHTSALCWNEVYLI